MTRLTTRPYHPKYRTRQRDPDVRSQPYMEWVRSWADALIGHEPITSASNLSATTGRCSTGQMPDRWAEVYRHDMPTYTVMSYETPIAWYSGERSCWVIPAVKYSVTTSKAQGIIRRVLAHAGITYRED